MYFCGILFSILFFSFLNQICEEINLKKIKADNISIKNKNIKILFKKNIKGNNSSKLFNEKK